MKRTLLFLLMAAFLLGTCVLWGEPGEAAPPGGRDADTQRLRRAVETLMEESAHEVRLPAGQVE